MNKNELIRELKKQEAKAYSHLQDFYADEDQTPEYKKAYEVWRSYIRVINNLNEKN